MEPAVLSERYQVRRLTEADVEAIYQLCADNPLFYQHCPPFVTRESIRADSRALPPGKTAADKYYLGYFQGDKLAAVLDLILDYPRAQTAFVGLFMLARQLQGRGVGSAIVAEGLRALARQGYTHVRLGYVKGNPQSEAFWLKNGFRPTGIETRPASYTVVVLERPTAQPE